MLRRLGRHGRGEHQAVTSGELCLLPCVNQGGANALATPLGDDPEHVHERDLVLEQSPSQEAHGDTVDLCDHHPPCGDNIGEYVGRDVPIHLAKKGEVVGASIPR